MNNTDFTYILQHPEQINVAQTEALQSVINEFPYFQSARAIYLKALKNSDSYKYNQALKTTAAYTTDRSILFDLITSEEFLQNKISEQIKLNIANLKDIEVDVEDISVHKKVSLDDNLEVQINETKGVLDPELFEPKTEDNLSKAETELISKINLDNQLKKIKTTENSTENTENQTNEASKTEIIETEISEEEKNVEETIEASPEKTLQLGKPLEFNKTETHSFAEWLKLTKLKPIERLEIEDKDTSVKTEKAEQKPISTKQKKFNLIDKFIKTNPKIKPEKTNTPNVDLAKLSIDDPESLTTETLARIYIEQGYYKKAITAYNILSLKYPEKSSFFADQIQAVKRLQKKQKK